MSLETGTNINRVGKIGGVVLASTLLLGACAGDKARGDLSTFNPTAVPIPTERIPSEEDIRAELNGAMTEGIGIAFLSLITVGVGVTAYCEIKSRRPQRRR